MVGTPARALGRREAAETAALLLCSLAPVDKHQRQLGSSLGLTPRRGSECRRPHENSGLGFYP